jgi:hypothetical protein
VIFGTVTLLYWVSNCPGNMPKYYPGNILKYYSTKYHYRNLHEVYNNVKTRPHYHIIDTCKSELLC